MYFLVDNLKSGNTICSNIHGRYTKVYALKMMFQITKDDYFL